MSPVLSLPATVANTLSHKNFSLDMALIAHGQHR